MADVAPAADKKKPEKPNQEAFNQELAKAEKEYQDALAKYNAAKTKVNDATPNSNKDAPTPTQKRRQELIAQLNEIRTKQGVGKNARNSKTDQMKRLDEQLKNRIAEQKTARGKLAYKSTDELERAISGLDQQVNTGMMKLVDEKKALVEISNLKKQRKNFTQIDTMQKDIDDLKHKIKDIKDSMDDPEARALSDQYNKIQAELDTIKAEQDSAFKNLSGLRDERTKWQTEQSAKWQVIKQIKDNYYAAKKAHGEWEREAKQKARERQKAEREKYENEKKMERAQKMLQEASDPAYLEEIRRAISLLNFFDPSSASTEKAPLLASSGMTAQATRKVDDSGLKGTKLVRKEDRDEEYLPATSKKGKKGKKGGATAEKSGFSCPPSVMEDCGFVGVDPPMSTAAVPETVEKIKGKLAEWKADQQAQTQRNIEKAKKEIEKLEADEAAEASGPATNGADSDKKTNGKVESVTAELKDASLENKAE
ncbi:hypothetical protein GGR57DRAFT_430242 [Xylariaceae sp. FL1272]|nr:hypothetical protein GGR57DRAFT_430242 [Xylariaceae sp. FL1272]